jgi:GNAT superfamily N-acetyltransferase
MSVGIRQATMEDAAEISTLIYESVHGLSAADYSVGVIEAALKSAWGLDTQLLQDGTYYLLTLDGPVAACGGWSFRSTLFGSDAMTTRDSAKLVPGRDAARIRAFFVRPAFARRGLGSLLLKHCEMAAWSAGFRSLSLGATEPGRRLYRKHGYNEGRPVSYDLGQGLMMEVVPMFKSLKSPFVVP